MDKNRSIRELPLPEINVLLVEDDEDEHTTISDSLARVGHSKFNLHWIADFDAGLEAISGGKHDVCLLDYLLGDSDGLEFIREAARRGYKTPIIFLTGRESCETDLQAMKEGASDCLVKGEITPSLVERSIRYSIERNRHRNQLEEMIQARTIELVKARDEAERRAEKLGRDITDRKKAEEALRESEEKFRMLAETSPAAIIIYQGGKYVYVNPASEPITGYTRAELLAQTPGDFIQPDYHEQVKEMISRREQGEGPLAHYELKIHTKDGQRRWMDCKTVSIRYGNKPAGLVVAFDITERKQAEKALQESEERFRAMADSIPQLSWVAHSDGSVFWYNRRWYDYTGTEPKQMEGWGWQSVIAPEILPELLQRLEVSIAKGQSFEMEHPIRSSDGRFCWFLTRVMPLKDSQGRIIRWFGTATDISAKREYEQALKKAKEELEARVEERTAALTATNRALGEYAAKLESLNQELQEFAFVASHDLQEPLRKIQMFSDLLKGETISEEKRIDYFGRMHSAAERMRAMIDALLGYSRIATKGRPFSEVSLAVSVKKALEMLEFRVLETGARVEVGELPSVEADPSQMVQLFQNLLENAFKFSREESPPQVKISSEEAGNGRVRVIVEDNGIGFDENQLDRIFVLFERLHGKSDCPGTGIGLAICRKVVERHGGTITAKSTPGQGSTFIVELPARQTRSG